MNNVLFDFINVFAQAYLDDILIYSKTRSQHVKHVQKVLTRLHQANLQVDIKKCEFHIKKTKFLGLMISTEGLEMDPEKVAAIAN